MVDAAPLFSVLMPTHNRPDSLAYAIQSVLAQTERSFELLVVGDGAAANVAGCKRSGGEAEDARDRKQPCRGSSEVHGREGGGLIGASHWTECRIRTRPKGVEQSLGCE